MTSKDFSKAAIEEVSSSLQEQKASVQNIQNDPDLPGQETLQEPKIGSDTVQEINELPKEEIVSDIEVDSLKKQAVDRLYEDEVALKENQNEISGNNDQLYDPTALTDASPYSDFLPLIRTRKQKQELQIWKQEIPNSNNQTFKQQIPQQITGVPNAAAQSIANLPNGYNFGYNDKNPLKGECLYQAQQWTMLPSGQNWRSGSAISEKKSSLDSYAKQGLAFYPGQDSPMTGNTVIFNGVKYGHVAVVAEIKDGMMRLEEANYNNDHRFKNDRWVSLDDPTIYGFMKTVKRN